MGIFMFVLTLLGEIMKNDHLYLSTACYHELHSKCRLVCKYCGEDCICPCHVRKHDSAGKIVSNR